MRFDRFVVAAAALATSTILIACGSDKNNNSPGTGVVTTPGLSSTPLSTNPLSTTGSSTMDTSSSGSATTLP